MFAGDALLDLARASVRRSVFIVGTAKNAGKTVAMRAIARAAQSRGLRLGMTSTGRDGEAVDAVDSLAKPRLFLSEGTIVATARTLLPRHPASEILDLSPWNSAAGTIVLARVRRAGHFELAGPSAAAGIRACVQRLAALDCEQIIVDGAVDRVAALAGGGDAVIVSVGAAGAATMEQAVDDVRALCARLRIPAYDPDKPLLRLDGALTPARASQVSREAAGRQIVVRDPTQVAAGGKALPELLHELNVRCERPLHVVAATVASIGRERYFEPRAFARAVARATGLPTFDVYADTMVGAA